MTNEYMNPQNQPSSQNFRRQIKFRSIGFSIVLLQDYQLQFKEQIVNIKLRGGGSTPPSLPKEISLEEIVKLILLRSSPSYPKEKQFKNRVNQIFHKIPKVIDGYGNIQNEMLSLLICEQLGSHYQSEFDQLQNFLDLQQFELKGLKYQYELMITPKEQKEKINTDQNMKDLQKLEYQFKSIQILIENIQKIEMQLRVSESLDFKDQSSLLIYKLKYCFEKLFWIFFNLDQDIVFKNIKDLYENLIVNSKSIHIYNQWITLISNLYRWGSFQLRFYCVFI